MDPTAEENDATASRNNNPEYRRQIISFFINIAPMSEKTPLGRTKMSINDFKHLFEVPLSRIRSEDTLYSLSKRIKSKRDIMKRRTMGTAQKAIAPVKIRLFLIESDVLVSVLILGYWVRCGREDIADGIKIPTINVVKLENPFRDILSKRTMIDNDANAMKKNIIVENSRRVTIAIVYPDTRNTHVSSEKDANIISSVAV